MMGRRELMTSYGVHNTRCSVLLSIKKFQIMIADAYGVRSHEGYQAPAFCGMLYHLLTLRYISNE
jgi:acid phosphatase family membrane protein YuiD